MILAFSVRLTQRMMLFIANYWCGLKVTWHFICRVQETGRRARVLQGMKRPETRLSKSPHFSRKMDSAVLSSCRASPWRGRIWKTIKTNKTKLSIVLSNNGLSLFFLIVFRLVVGGQQCYTLDTHSLMHERVKVVLKRYV